MKLIVEKLLKMNRKIQIFDSSLLISQSYFNNGGTQLYLILKPKPLYYALKRPGGTENVVSWKYKGLPAEKLTTLTTTANSLSPSIKWYKFYSSKYNNFFHCL